MVPCVFGVLLLYVQIYKRSGLSKTVRFGLLGVCFPLRVGPWDPHLFTHMMRMLPTQRTVVFGPRQAVEDPSPPILRVLDAKKQDVGRHRAGKHNLQDLYVPKFAV